MTLDYYNCEHPSYYESGWTKNDELISELVNVQKSEITQLKKCQWVIQILDKYIDDEGISLFLEDYI